MNTRSYRNIILSFLLLLLVTAPAAMAQSEGDDLPEDVDVDGLRRAQTGFRFLATSVSARAAAMANAATALDQGALSMFYNPAAMSQMQSLGSISLGQIQFIADTDYNFASAAFRPRDGMYGAFGVTLMSVDYGEFLGTTVANNDRGFVDTGHFTPSALAVGFGYARALTDRFAVGGNVKYARQRLGESIVPDVGTEAQSAIAVDLGVQYRTGFRNLTFAAVARNFAREVTYAEESFELPLALQLGLAMDMVELTSISPDLHSFVVSVDAERPRDYYENMKVGGEYTFMNTFSLRGGYIFPSDERSISAGAGLNADVGPVSLNADYAYTAFGRLGSVNRIMLTVGF